MQGPYVLTIHLTCVDAESIHRTLLQHARQDSCSLPEKQPEGASLVLHGNLKQITRFVEGHRDLIMGHGFLEISPHVQPVMHS